MSENPLMRFVDPAATYRQVAGEAQDRNMRQQHADLQTAGVLSSLQDKQRARDSEQALKAALATGDMNAVARLNPQVAGVLANLQHTQAQTGEIQRQNAFYSPQNMAQFQTPGTPGHAAETASPDVVGPPSPQIAPTPPTTDLRGMALAGAAQGIKGTEPLLNHLAIRDQAQASLAQTGQLRRESLQKDYDLAAQRSEDQRLSRAEQAQSRADMIRLAASLRQPHQPQIVQTADGVYTLGANGVPQALVDPNTNKQLMPKGAGTNSKAVQNLGTAFEKAGLSVTNQAVNDAETAVAKPEILDYLTGPKKLLPDFALNKEVTDARQAIEKVFNITLKDRSGAAVTNQELARLKSEFGAGVFKKPEQLKTAIDRARQIVDTHYRGIAAGFGPDTLGAYNENLQGMGGQPILQSAPTAAPTRRATDVPTGVDAKLWDVMTPAEKKLWGK